jgi:hypothetical protein
MTEVENKLKLKDVLINKKIKLVPIVRGSSWLPSGHDGEFRFTDTMFSVDLPISKETGQRINILTKEEQFLFEEELNLQKGDMSFYDKHKGFWADARGRVSVPKEGLDLDLIKPLDFIKWKILQVNKTIAPSWKERFNSGDYTYALVDADEETKVSTDKLSLMKTIYRHVGKIEESASKMRDVLKLYGKKTNSDDLTFLKGEIQKLIDKDSNEFIKIMEDKKFVTKIMIEDALTYRIIERTASKGYTLKGGDLIGRTIQETVEWIENPTNQDIVLKIKAQIEGSKD